MTHWEAALTALEAGRLAEARAEALAHLGETPRSGQGFLVLASALSQQGELDKALLALGQALALEATGSGYFLLGMVLEALGQPGFAERAFATALRLDPEHPTAMSRRLDCRTQQPASALPEAEAEALERLFSLARPSVTACLIVKNEAQNLAGCLESLNGWVDEVVVVDTGSTDDTVAIAESAGARVGHFAWCDDFSAARNASLALATSDWILVIDADEQLQVDDHDSWYRALRRREPGGYVIHQRNLKDDGAIENDAPVMRLFQRHEAIRFEGRLHEVVGPSIEALGWPTAELPGVRLVHTGYQSESMATHAKGARNLAIALKAAEEQPDDAFTLLQLARSYCFNHQPEASLPHFERLRALPGLVTLPLPFWVNFVTNLHGVYQAVGRPEAAEALLTEALGRLPNYPEFLFERGLVRFRLGRHDDAQRDFEGCLAANGQAFGLPVRPGLTGPLPRQALAELAEIRRKAPLPSVTACLIVKNEGKRLANCLKSLASWVDEIVVMDTGSSDDTVAIAESAGARVGHFAWCDDFSAARNASLALATSDWILVIDADEQLQIQDPDHWRMVLTGPCDAAVVTQSNVDASGRLETETQALRLFKRLPEVRFEGRLHETVLASLQAAGGLIGEAPFIRLLHTGYQADQVEGEAKGARNVRLAELVVAERPDDAEAWFDLARSHGLNQDHQAALGAFERLVDLPGGIGALGDRMWPYAIQTLQGTYQALGQDADAEDILDQAIEGLPGFPEFHWERAQLRLRRGDKAGAIADLETCRSAHGVPFPIPVRPGLTDTLPSRLLAALQRPSVSACLIVKNEGKRLASCLRSLDGWVDEIVVVDTGSTDDTVAIAESAGARVGHFAWCDDFSAARNASLALAASDWILVIDADEQLCIEDPEAWRRALDAADRAYSLDIHNVEADGRVASRTQSFPRLFRRHELARFRGRLHESPHDGLVALGWAVSPLGGAWVRHEGYSDAAIAGSDKLARNRQLAERMIADAPLDPEAWHFLASTCWLARDVVRALSAVTKLRRLQAEGFALAGQFKRTSYLVEAWVLAAVGREQDALMALDDGLRLLPGFAEYHFERGRLRATAGDAAGAIADFEDCLAAPAGAAERDGVTGYLAHAELVDLHAKAGRTDRAAHHLRLAAADPACPADEAAAMRALAERLTPPAAAPEPTLEAAVAALEAGRDEDASAAALAFLHTEPTSVHGFLVLATACLRLGKLDKALLAVSQALGHEATSAGYYLLGMILEALDQPAFAERAFAAALRLNPDHPTAMTRRLACRHRQPTVALQEADAAQIERLLGLGIPSFSA